MGNTFQDDFKDVLTYSKTLISLMKRDKNSWPTAGPGEVHPQLNL